MFCKTIGIILSIQVLIFISLSQCFAADTLSARTKYPIALLVQLNSEQSRMEAAARNKDDKALEEIKKDATGARRAIIRDFQDHFHYCPVYYYTDTNLNQVLNRKFDGVLMTADSISAKSIAIINTDTNYFIVYYGYPVSQAKHTRLVTDSVKYEYNSGEPLGKGLIINNYKLQQLSLIYNFEIDFDFLDKKSKQYSYESRQYNISYFPFAGKLNKELYKNPKKIPISHFIRQWQ